MRRFLSRDIPPFARALLVESGSRRLLENLLPTLYAEHPEAKLDLFTCYAGAPRNFRDAEGLVYRASNYPDRTARRRLLEELRGNRYLVVGIVCSAEPILTKWKWWLAWKLPAKVFILNENGDLFWLDRGHWAAIRHFAAFRAGLTGAGAVRTVSRLLLFPFTLCYLLLFAAAVHIRRRVRML